MLEIMLPSFVACLVLTGIHAYLGIHVIEREIIFVDLAIAQLASLGAIIGYGIGFDLKSLQAYLSSLLFTFAGAIFFSLSKKIKLSQEALIGIVYALTTAFSIILLDRIPGEVEHIKYMLVGNILFVEWNEIIKMAVLYSIVGAFHYIFRERFFSLSRKSHEVNGEPKNLFLWDFLFYATFGVVVTSSVKIAGVLLVFTYLIVPAFTSMMLFKKRAQRLIAGWIIGFLGSILGIVSSYNLDLPTGAGIVCAFGIILIIISTAKALVRI